MDRFEFGLEPSGIGFDLLFGRGVSDSGGGNGMWRDRKPGFVLFGQHDDFNG
jgi:hypothetical protein